jgi:hypothetical protein
MIEGEVGVPTPALECDWTKIAIRLRFGVDK